MINPVTKNTPIKKAAPKKTVKKKKKKPAAKFKQIIVPVNPVGAPLKYNKNVHPKMIAGFVGLGATIEQAAEMAGVSDSTLRVWIKKYPDLSAAVHGKKEDAVLEAERYLKRLFGGFHETETRSTVYLDAIEGGRVEQVIVEDGVLVKAGDAIAVLSNTSLQLEVLGREAAVTEQLNNMRTIELQLEQNRLSHKRNLVEIDYQIIRLNRSIARQRELAAKNLVA